MVMGELKSTTKAWYLISIDRVLVFSFSFTLHIELPCACITVPHSLLAQVGSSTCVDLTSMF